MGLNLTKPALAYDDQPPVDDQSPIIDPATGLPIKVKPRVSFFPNNASRDWQFAHDAAQAAQPAGFKESTFRPYEEAGAQQQVEKGRLENQQAQVNLAFTPLRYSQMGAELQNKRADTAWKSVHA